MIFYRFVSFFYYSILVDCISFVCCACLLLVTKYVNKVEVEVEVEVFRLF